MNLSASAWYDFCKDQGSLISGLLALGAGLLAYKAGRAQVSAAERQIQETNRNTVKDRVRAGLVANTQLLGIIKRTNGDIKEKLGEFGIRFAHPDPGSTVTFDFAQSVIFQVDTSVVFAALGAVDYEVVDKYMRFDAALTAYKSGAHKNADWHKKKLIVISIIADDLQRQLEEDAKRIKRRLSDLSGT